MRISFFSFFVLLNTLAYSQSTTTPGSTNKVKNELETLWNNMQDAAVKKDRKALESFYADEFLFIHSSARKTISSEGSMLSYP
jgi:hypothetical protein